ncbi:MAG: hypothetical protein ACRDPW_10135, partial [Mycobacteriales bacterium]
AADVNTGADATGSPDAHSDHANSDPANTVTALPNWQKLTNSARVRWHDHRTHWMSDQPPPVVTRAPQQRHRIANWSIALRLIDTQAASPMAQQSSSTAQAPQIQLRGTLDYLPPPQTGVWWVGMLATLAAIVAGSLALGRLRSAARYLSPVLGGLLLLAATAELIDSIGRVLDTGATDLDVIGRLLTTQTYGTLTALAALVAGGLAIGRHAGGPLAAALAAACLTVLGALTDVAVFSHSNAMVPWSGDLARLCTAATLVLGAAVTVGAWRISTTRLPT